MKSICFVHTGKAQLPDLSAYKDYFAPSYKVADSKELKGLEQYDILWFFMGLHRYTPLKSQFVVHEYSSLSLPPFARLKDRIKVLCEKKPDLRVFQNQHQSDLLNFNDGIPAVFRDMGVAEQFYNAPMKPKLFDLVYVGAMDSSRQIHKALDKLLALKPDITVMLVGKAPEHLVLRYKNLPGIKFIGAVHYQNIPGLLQQAHFGLNYVPDCYPYNLQSSTKLLEYLAMGIPVIGNITAWSKQFIRQNPAVYFDIEQLSTWPSTSPEFYNRKAKLSETFLWHNRISDAGFESYLPK